MAFARDWDEIRPAARLFILNGVALLATVVVFRNNSSRQDTLIGCGGKLALMTGIMLALYLVEERRGRRPTPDRDTRSSTTPG